MSAKDLAIAIIREFEGLSLKAYPDPASGGDPWTIGFGATGKGIGPGVLWTLEQAEDRLERDSGAEGVLAVRVLETMEVEYLDGATRVWLNVAVPPGPRRKAN